MVLIHFIRGHFSANHFPTPMHTQRSDTCSDSVQFSVSKILCNLIVHYKVLLWLYLHTLRCKIIRPFWVPHFWQLFFPRQVLVDQHPGLGKSVGKKGQKNVSHHFSYFHYEHHSDHMPVSICVCMHTSHGLTNGVYQTVCLQRMLLLGVLGTFASCAWEFLLSPFGEGTSNFTAEFHVTQVCFSMQHFLQVLLGSSQFLCAAKCCGSLSSKSKDKKKHLLGNRCNVSMFAQVN